MKHLIGIRLFALPISLVAQEHKNINYWLDNMVLPSAETPAMQLKSYGLNDRLLTPSPIHIEKQLVDFPKLKPLSYTNFLQQYDIWKPTKNILLENNRFKSNYPLTFSAKDIKNVDLRINYQLTNRLSVELSGYYIADRYKNPTILGGQLYQSEIAANLSYSITKNLKIKTGMQYVYNLATRRWEYIYMTGIAFNF